MWALTFLVAAWLFIEGCLSPSLSFGVTPHERVAKLARPRSLAREVLAIDGAGTCDAKASSCTLTLTTTHDNDYVLCWAQASKGKGFSVSGGNLDWSTRAADPTYIEFEAGVPAPQKLHSVPITISGGGAYYIAADCAAFSGVATAAPYDKGGRRFAGAGAQPSIPITTVHQATVIIGAFSLKCANCGIAAGPGFTAINAPTATHYQLVEYKIVSTAQRMLAVTVTPGAGGGVNAGVADAIHN